MPRPRHTSLAAQRARELRRAMTISEARLWQSIRGRSLGVRFRRQVPIGHWIVDFACLDPKIVIEVDDESHHWRDESTRTEYLQEQGFTILRYDNESVAQEVEMVITSIRIAIDRLRASS